LERGIGWMSDRRAESAGGKKRGCISIEMQPLGSQAMAERVGFEPTRGNAPNTLAGCRLKPLGHLSPGCRPFFGWPVRYKLRSGGTRLKAGAGAGAVSSVVFAQTYIDIGTVSKSRSTATALLTGTR
jgi:hypothetical protein